MIEITRVFQKTVLAHKLHAELEAIIPPIFLGLMVKGQDVTVLLSQEPTTAQDQDILDTVNNHDPTPTEFDVETDATKARHTAGEALYQKVYADVTMRHTFATVDASITGYDVLIKLRCMLKDGSGKSALRFLMRDAQVAAMLTTEQIELFRGWIRQYCWDFRTQAEIDAGHDYNTFMGVLDAVETLENV